MTAAIVVSVVALTKALLIVCGVVLVIITLLEVVSVFCLHISCCSGICRGWCIDSSRDFE